ncbi:MAG: sodium:solute symporter family protein [Syntrophobacteraceae bacterium]|jgi:SSS family solute:Na+ symporter
MVAITSGHIMGMVVTLLIIVGAGIYAGTRVKGEKDFSGASRKAGSAVVAGTIMGTLVGGSSTIGTAQLAFQYGLDGWWFTLGAGIACLLLGTFMLRPLYSSNKSTIPQYLTETYGQAIGPISSVFTSIGIFINVIAQGLAAVALLTSMAHVSTTVALVISTVLVLAYVLAGGLQGTGIVGTIKLTMLYGAVIAAGGIALYKFGGMSGLFEAFPEHFPWFSLFGRGFSLDFAAGFSLVVGVLSTQTYIQAVLSARSFSQARKGALISAFFIPPVGIGGILVGMYMKAHITDFPGLKSADVLPTFILHYMPPLLGGAVLATLLVAVVGTWAGLNLGISTMLTRDIYKRYIDKKADDKKALLVQRVLILCLCAVTIVAVSSNMGGLILGFSFLSMGLRGCSALFPLLGAMFFKRFVSPVAGISAAVLGPLTDLIWHLVYPKGLDPLYPGLLVSAGVLFAVGMFTRRKPEIQAAVSTGGE